MAMARTSRMWVTILLTITIFSLGLPAHAKYSGGTGDPNDPYQIATADDLMLMGDSPDDYDKHFILTADIDLDPNLPGRKVFNRAIIAPDMNDVEGGFQGTIFTGVFDGGRHTISNLTVVGNRQLGLFGQLGSWDMPDCEVKNIGLVHVNISGSGSQAGGLVGRNYGYIVASYSTGSINGTERVGGLVGGNNGTITTSYSTGMVNGDTWIGGLVGSNWGNITTCYATGAVDGNDDIGGLAGYNSSSITNSYSTSEVSGTNAYAGGLVGRNFGSITTSYSKGSLSGNECVGGLVGDNSGSIAMSYSTCTVKGDGNVGGLVGRDLDSSISSSFWDIEKSGQSSSSGGTGLTKAEMEDINTYLNAGWDFVGESLNGTCDYWEILPDDSPHLRYYPDESPVMPEGSGTAEAPYLIRNARDLGTVWFKPLAYYRMEASVDLSGITWSMAAIPCFGGTFDGNGYTISNLHIEGGGYLGLFGQLGSEANISYLGVEMVDVNGTGNYVGGLVGLNERASITITSSYSTGIISGDNYVGGLVGRNGGGYPGGTVSKCYSKVSVRGSGRYIGGLVGLNYGGTVSQCYSHGTVSGSSCVGGLVGLEARFSRTIMDSYSTATVTATIEYAGGLVGCNVGGITRCYSTGLVTAPSWAGGLVGVQDKSSVTGPGTVTDCFWDIETSRQVTSQGGLGKTTAKMQTASTFLPWGTCVSCWTIDDGRDYPHLAWENELGEIITGPTYSGGTGTTDDPYLISNAEDLNVIGLSTCHLGEHFKLTTDIDLAGLSYNQAVIEAFYGVFDGNGHTISGLTIVGGSYLGLFGYLGSNASVQNLRLEDVNITGSGDCVGSLAGSNNGAVTRCYSISTVSGDSDVGGLVGENSGYVTQCYSTGAVNGIYFVGGIVGSNDWGSRTIADCYSTASVSGHGSVGGLVGYNCGDVTHCYSTGTVSGNDGVGGLVGVNGSWWRGIGSVVMSIWDMEASGLTVSDGGIGKTTAQMQTSSTFLNAGWDFVDEVANGTDDIWWIDEGQDYPRLWWVLVTEN